MVKNLRSFVTGKAALLFLLTYLCSIPALHAGFDFNRNCRKAYREITEFHLDQAQRLIDREIKHHPSNLIPVYLENYIDFLRLMAYENPEEYDNKLPLKKLRIKQLKTGPDSSPYYNFVQAEVYLHWALVQAKFGDLFPAAFDFNRCYKLLEENREKHPGFLPHLKTLLPVKASIGTLPSSWRIIAKILGFKGDLNESINAYRDYLFQIKKTPKYRIYYSESAAIFAFMQYHLLNNPEGAWETIKSVTRDYPHNPLSAFARADIAMRAKKLKEVRQTAKTQLKKNPTIPHIHYLGGLTYLYQLDPKARVYFGHYLDQFKGDSYMKDTYLKLGWSFLLEGDTANYNKCIYLVNNLNRPIRDEDKQALQETGHYDQRNLPLLKARLSFDGGYYHKAHKILKAFNPENLLHSKDKMEYYYRLGRIYQETGKYSRALNNFSKLSKWEKQWSGRYFLPASCYYSGIIYEKTGKFKEAEMQYEKCLEYDDYPYENSFGQKSRAGLKRIEGFRD